MAIVVSSLVPNDGFVVVVPIGNCGRERSTVGRVIATWTMSLFMPNQTIVFDSDSELVTDVTLASGTTVFIVPEKAVVATVEISSP